MNLPAEFERRNVARTDGRYLSEGKRMRLVLVTMLLCLGASGASATEDAKPTRQFIERSEIQFPRHIGKYTLLQQDFDPEQVIYGVSLEYAIAGAPMNTRLTVYVYPIGRVVADDALARGINDVIEGIQGMAKEGEYSEVVIGTPADMAMPALEPDDTEDSEDSNGSDASDEADESDADEAPLSKEEAGKLEAAALVALAQVPPVKTDGRKVLLSYRYKDIDRHSAGYIFYRHLYLVKFRLTLPATDASLAEVEAFGDDAARQLVPAIRIANEGSCANVVVSPEELDQSYSKALMTTLVQGSSRARNEGCGLRLKPADADTGTQEIVYPAGIWK